MLRAIGAVEDVTLPALPYEAITRTILFAEAASALEGLVEDGALAELTAPEDRYTLYARDAILAKDYIKALRLRAVVAREIDRILAGLDALVAPGRFNVAPVSTSRSGAPSAARSWIRRERSGTRPGSRRSPSPTGSASAGCRRASSSWGARGARTRSSPRPGPTRRAPTGTGVTRRSADLVRRASGAAVTDGTVRRHTLDRPTPPTPLLQAALVLSMLVIVPRRRTGRRDG